MLTKSALERYVDTHRKSRELYERALNIFPSGVTHDLRYFEPFPIYVSRAQGTRKWDVDGHEYVDFIMASGAFFLGYAHPSVVEAVTTQVANSTHYSACHELELEWGQLIQQLIPSAKRVKFVASGTEAIMMALRLARAATGRQKIVKFEGHYHGWFDHLLIGVIPPYDKPYSQGVLPEDLANTITLPVGDEALLEETLSRGDVAGVIVEATGASYSAIPMKKSFLEALRRITTKYDTVLIFDEVISGFRWSPGGVQALRGITPDITVLAKIMGGGLPGAAVVGREEIFERMKFKDDPHWNRYERVPHPGTFNANPLSAAAGIATLKLVATGEPNRKADEAALKLRQGIHKIIQDKGVEGGCYGEASTFHIYLGPCDRDTSQYDGLPPTQDPTRLKGIPSSITKGIALNMLVNGVHTMYRGFTAAVHTDEDIQKFLEAFDKSLDALIADGLVSLRK